MASVEENCILLETLTSLLKTFQRLVYTLHSENHNKLVLLWRVNLVVDARVITQRRSRRHANIIFDVCSRAASKKLQQNCCYGHTVHFVQRTHCHFKQFFKCSQMCTLHARLAMGGKFILRRHEYVVSFLGRRI